MAFAQIRIDQQANATPVGVPGRARDDILAGAAVTLRNGDPAGVKTYRWSLLHRPYGSAAVLNNPTSAVATIVPDVAGFYRVRLEVNQGGAGEYDVRTFAVRDAASLALPASGMMGDEANYQVSPGTLNADGWTREMNERQLRALDLRSGGIPNQFIAAFDTHVFTIDWGLPMAVLEILEINATVSTDSSVTIFADAALAIPIASWVNVNTAPPGWFMRTVTALAGRFGTALEDNKVRLSVRNNNADSTYRVSMRLKAP